MPQIRVRVKQGSHRLIGPYPHVVKKDTGSRHLFAILRGELDRTLSELTLVFTLKIGKNGPRYSDYMTL